MSRHTFCHNVEFFVPQLIGIDKIQGSKVPLKILVFDKLFFRKQWWAGRYGSFFYLFLKFFFGTMPKISFVRSFSNEHTAGIWFLAAQKKTNDVDLSPTSVLLQLCTIFTAVNCQPEIVLHPLNRFTIAKAYT